MTFYSTRREPDDCRALRREVEQLRLEREQAQERQEREDESRRRERQEERRWRECHADTFEEAFARNGSRLRAEMADEKRLAAADPEWALANGEQFWQRHLDANSRAAALYAEGQRALIEGINATLAAEFPGVELSLDADNPSALLEW